MTGHQDGCFFPSLTSSALIFVSFSLSACRCCLMATILSSSSPPSTSKPDDRRAIASSSRAFSSWRGRKKVSYTYDDKPTGTPKKKQTSPPPPPPPQKKKKKKVGIQGIHTHHCKLFSFYNTCMYIIVLSVHTYMYLSKPMLYFLKSKNKHQWFPMETQRQWTHY